jgi:hypothetical protein
MPTFIVVHVTEWDAPSREEAEQQAKEANSLYEGPHFTYANEPDSIAHPEQIPDTFLSD